MRTTGGSKFEGQRDGRSPSSKVPSSASVEPLVRSTTSARPPGARDHGVFGAGVAFLGAALAFVGVFVGSGLGAQITGTIGVALVLAGLVSSILEVIGDHRTKADAPFAKSRPNEAGWIRRAASIVAAAAAVAGAVPTWRALGPDHRGVVASSEVRLISGCPEDAVAPTATLHLESNVGPVEWSVGDERHHGASLDWPLDPTAPPSEGRVEVWLRAGSESDVCRIDVHR